MTERIAEASARFKARVLYLLVFVTGMFSRLFVRGRLVANLIATACYIAVTLPFYDIFKPVTTNARLTGLMLTRYSL